MTSRIAFVLGVLVCFTIAPSFANADEVKPFGTLDCVPQEGVRFCEGAVDKRVATFDGVPLDANVTLPATGDRRLPLIVMLHGWGGSKSGLDEQTKSFAQEGYAVLSYTARGFGDSCGSPQSRVADPEGCQQGWIRLADSRYEVRDTQHLAGLLADQLLINPKRIGVTGVSYGGGQSMMLATLRDRVRMPDGSYETWRSPVRRFKMRIAAAAPVIPWTDLVYSLMPNGRTLDYLVTSQTDDLTPVGVMKQSFVTGLYALGQASGFYAPAGQDPAADLTTWFSLINAGEPYLPELAGPIIEEISSNHSAFYLAAPKGQPAPLLISNGFTDDLFPIDEATRYANRYPRARIAQMHFDFGHQRGQNKAADQARLEERIHAWFKRYVRGKGADALKGVEVMTQTCPAETPSGGPFAAKSWRAIHPGEVRFTDAQVKTVVPNDTLGPTIDPIGGQGACATTDATDQLGTATYRLPESNGYTMIGAPTVIADLAVTAADPATSELAARLWDVAPDGTQTLVSRGLYRPSAAGGQVVFQLHANAWRFESGHVPKLELLGRDAPYGRASNLPFTIDVSNLDLRLPVREQPEGQVSAPAAPMVPPGGVLAR